MDFMEIRELFHISGDIGYSEKTISKAVQKFGTLPSVLVEYYRQLGRHQELNHALYHFQAPENLKVLPHSTHLCLCRADERMPLYWYIDLEELESDNPQVHYYYLEDENDGIESETLETFLYGFAYFQACFSLPYNSKGNFLYTFEQAEEIQKNYRLKPYSIERLKFYGNSRDEIINVQMERSGALIMYACTSEEQFQKIKSILQKNYIVDTEYDK